MEKESVNQKTNSVADKPWLWQKGQSGNIKGRPKGKTMKEYAKDYISRMTDEERDKWLEGLEKETIWKMAEGNPASTTDLTTGGDKIDFTIVNYASDTNTPPVST